MYSRRPSAALAVAASVAEWSSTLACCRLSARLSTAEDIVVAEDKYWIKLVGKLTQVA